MTARRTTQIRKPLFAVLAVVALLATACSSGVTQITTERASVASDQAPEGHSPEYGATLEEFGKTVELAAPAVDATSIPSGSVPTEGAEPESEESAEYPTIDWDDLIPPGSSGPDIIARYQDRLESVEAGSAEATALYEEMQAEFDSGAVNPELDGQQIRLAGFVAPLTYDGDLVTEFLLVPNFGACIHVPPPPPNQTIMVTLAEGDGLTTDEAWGAVWVQGTITLEAATTELAPASYTISNATSGIYDDF